MLNFDFMNKRFNKHIIIIIVVISSLTGLGIIQINWLNKAVNTNKQLYKQKIDLIAEQVGELYRENSMIPDIVHKTIINKDDAKPVIDRITSMINKSFSENSLEINYKFGIYKHENDTSIRKILTIGNIRKNEYKSFQCINDVKKAYGWASLTCNKGYQPENSYHLAIFPSYGTLVANEFSGTLISSILFLILILFAFFFAMKIIRNLKNASDFKNNFINNLTHEFNTPIFTISLATKGLNQVNSEIDNKQLQSYVDVIQSENKRLKSHVNKILQLSSFDSGKFLLNKLPTNIHEQIIETVNNFGLIIEEKGGYIHLDLKARQHLIMVDQIHLKDVWYNLIDNAIKYNDSKPYIEISTKNSKGHLEINIKDNGIGITQEHQQLIFDKYYRIPTGYTHNAGGYGIGLSYIKRILKMHGGSINVISKKNMGSTFKIKLPLL